jgi:hypothetical protein
VTTSSSPMTQQNPEMRRRVAEACSPEEPWEVLGKSVRSPHGGYWSPGAYVWQWQALVRKIAELIDSKYNDLASKHLSVIPAEVLDTRLRKALSTGSTNDLEALLVELLEAG